MLCFTAKIGLATMKKFAGVVITNHATWSISLSSYICIIINHATYVCSCMHMNCDCYLKLAGYVPLLNCMFQYLLIKLRYSDEAKLSYIAER